VHIIQLVHARFSIVCELQLILSSPFLHHHNSTQKRQAYQVQICHHNKKHVLVKKSKYNELMIPRTAAEKNMRYFIFIFNRLSYFSCLIIILFKAKGNWLEMKGIHLVILAVLFQQLKSFFVVHKQNMRRNSGNAEIRMLLEKTLRRV